MATLTGWENFYVIVGSSAGALIGLQFVVITLIAEIPSVRDLEHANRLPGQSLLQGSRRVTRLKAIESATA